MFYWKSRTHGMLYLNEYWVFIPVSLLGNYFLIRKIRSDKKIRKELEILKKQLEREHKIRKILLIALGLNSGIYFSTRGGASDVISFLDVEYIRKVCEIEEGIRYLDNNRMRKIIHHLFKHKSKNDLIYITATAACHLANTYGKNFIAFPFAINDFGITSVYQTARKAVVTILLGSIAPLVVYGGPSAFTVAFVIGTSALKFAFTNLDFLETSAVDETVPVSELETRMPNTPDVVVLNNRDKITMNQPMQENYECWLADQRLANPNCEIKPTEIPGAIDLVSHDLKYDEIVNMQDVTGLDQVEFSDKYDLGQTKPSISELPEATNAKQVNFLDKFGDSAETVDKSESWNLDQNDFTPPKRRYLRTRNEL